MKSPIIKRYSELIRLPTFEERYEYLKLTGKVGIDTFGFDRVFNQQFYHSTEWKRVRNYVIARDNGCDLAHPDHPLAKRVLIHHINPISLDDIAEATEYLLNPEYLICVSHDTHNAIHYGTVVLANQNPLERCPNDTCPWKQ